MTHILDEQIHTTAILDAQAHAGRVGKCDEPTDEGTPCGCEFTLPTDTDAIVLCPACGSSAILEPVSLPPAPEARQASSEETRACLACGGAHIITKCPAIKAAMDEAPGCVQPLGELETAIADNAGLLALLRELDYANPTRAEQLLAQARDAEHPGRELMASTLEHVVDLRYQISATRDALAERDRTITKLREQLATAHAALGQSVAAMEEGTFRIDDLSESLECECVECEECGKMPAKCSGTKCAATCSCSECDWHMAQYSKKLIAAALAAAQEALQ